MNSLLALVLFFAVVIFPATSRAASVDALYENSNSPLISLITQASSSIDIEIYTMKDLNVISALKSAMSRGVQLRIVQTGLVIDPCHVFDAAKDTDDSTCTALKSFVIYVNKHHGTYVPFDYELCGTPGKSCFEHGKMLIADSKKVLLSTGNFDPTSLCDASESPTTCNRDFSVVSTDSDVIQTLQTIFNHDVKGNAFDLSGVLAASAAKRVTVSPDSLRPLITLIQSAKKTIQIENQYLKDPDMNQALIDAAKRGVQVFVMVESVSNFAKPTDTQAQAWTDTFTSFDKAGIHSKIFNGKIQINGIRGYMHAKVILIDSKTAWIGSVNGSAKSLTENREYGIISTDATLVRNLNKVIYSDFNDPNAETWKQSLSGSKDFKGSNSTDKGDDSDNSCPRSALSAS